MKKLLAILAVILVVMCVVVGCTKKEDKKENNGGSNGGSSQGDQAEEKVSYENYFGTGKTGVQVKEMIALVVEHNKSASDSEKVGVEIDAFKGKINGTSDNDRIEGMKAYVGGQFSLYDISYGENLADGAKRVVVKQTVGTREDPDIPLDAMQENYSYEIGID